MKLNVALLLTGSLFLSANFNTVYSQKTVTILKKVEVNPDTLKTLIIVPDNEKIIKQVKEMSYFKEIKTIKELQQEIIAKGLTDKIPNVSDRIGLYNAYKYYKPFVMLYFSSEDKKLEGLRIRLNLFDPGRSDIIFQNEVRINLMWEGTSDKKTIFPLLKSLAEYLNERK